MKKDRITAFLRQFACAMKDLRLKRRVFQLSDLNIRTDPVSGDLMEGAVIPA